MTVTVPLEMALRAIRLGRHPAFFALATLAASAAVSTPREPSATQRPHGRARFARLALGGVRALDRDARSGAPGDGQRQPAAMSLGRSGSRPGCATSPV